MGTYITDSLDKEEGRGIVINWQNVLRRIVSDYEEHTSLPHGVQKDAVQNCWDARIDKKKAKDWGAAFELLDSGTGTPIVTITDWGTTGLTGAVLDPNQLNEDLPSEERWARFENMAFTKDPSEEALGARGQGKFIFVASSSTQTIVYDTYREDGVYRLGVLDIEGATAANTWYMEGQEAADWLFEYLPALQPLDHIGTRVIIVDPINELVEAIRSGQFLRAIGETWWEIIQKYDASISLTVDGQTDYASVPKELLLHETSSSPEIKVWEKANHTFTVGGKRYRIKKFLAVYVPDAELPQDIRGIAVQRGGMKVTTERYTYRRPETDACIYGYMSFDTSLDSAMAKVESSTHYTFNWRKSVPQAVRRYVNSELAQFYRELGFGPDPAAVKHRKRREAETRALLAANKVAKALGIAGRSKGGRGGTSNQSNGSRSHKLISLSMPDLELPTDSLRVEYDDWVKGIETSVHNRTDYAIQGQLKLFITFGSADGKVIHEFVEENLDIGPMSIYRTSSFQVHLTKRIFPAPGQYAVRARFVSLMKNPTEGMERKGKEVDKVSKIFYLAENPPGGGLFEEVIPVEWTDKERESILGQHSPGKSGGYVYHYNVAHKGYSAFGNDEDAAAEHVFRLLIHAVMEIDLESDNPALFNKDDLKSPNMVANKINLILGEAVHNYYS